ncbi:uncharacterized protein JCM6883_004330 [Sporobolomyces salmoneus]|uniref:uncharacterized protein n=1 Tax=Sporobolomyces salmoneus TaxID=183962 RepID=UPI00317747AB
MPISYSTGFSSGLCYPVFSDPLSNTSSLNLSHAPPAPIRWHVCEELGLSQISDGTINVFVLHPGLVSQGFRVYFSRDFKLLAPTRDEVAQGETMGVYASFLSMHNGDRGENDKCFYKCFGIVEPKQGGGGGGENGENVVERPPWFIEGQFGQVPPDLNSLRNHFIELKVFRALIKPGTPRGDGLLEPLQIQSIDQSSPIVTFKWFLATSSQLSLLGLLPSPQHPPGGRDDEGETGKRRIEFLIKMNETLIGMLDTDQRKRFVEVLIQSKEVGEIKRKEKQGGRMNTVQEGAEEGENGARGPEGEDDSMGEQTREKEGDADEEREKAVERRRSLRKRI